MKPRMRLKGTRAIMVLLLTMLLRQDVCLRIVLRCIVSHIVVTVTEGDDEAL